MNRADLIARIAAGTIDHRCGACNAIMMPRQKEPRHAFLKRRYCNVWCQQRGKIRERMARAVFVRL